MKKHRLPLVSFITLVILLLIASTAGAAPKDGPAVNLSTAQTEFRASEDVVITVTLLNPTRHSVRILKWFTPADGVEEPIFTVNVNGTPVNYSGAIYKRPAPTGSDYLTLKSGESLAYSVNLGDYYDLSTTGQYSIYFEAASQNLYDEKGGSSTLPDSLTSATISLKIDGRAAKGKPTPPPPPPSGGNSFKACSSTQQSILVNARDQAKTYASSAEANLLAFPSGTARYLKWFGAFDASRFGTVTAHFTNLHLAWDKNGVTFDCSCKQNYYAYVYPSKPDYIYLCRVFWMAPLAGTDSQGGTLIHEMSHFPLVAGTDDYVYGQSGAMNLAITTPGQAIMNADNHEYYAENNPALP